MAADWYFPLDVDAWRGSAGLGSVSLAARGLFVELRILMHSSATPGCAVHPSGRGYRMAELAREAKCTQRQAQKALDELVAARVVEVREDGAIFNDRAYRDAQARDRKTEAARRAAEARWSAPEAEPDPVEPPAQAEAPTPAPPKRSKRAKPEDDTPIAVAFRGLRDGEGGTTDGGITERQLARLQNRNPGLDVRAFLGAMAGKVAAAAFVPPTATGLEAAARNWIRRELQSPRSRFRRGTGGPAVKNGSLLGEFARAGYDEAEAEVRGMQGELL